MRSGKEVRDKSLGNLKPIYYFALISGTYPLRRQIRNITVEDGHIEKQLVEDKLSKSGMTDVFKISWPGAICTTLWLAALILFDVHPFRMSRIGATSTNTTNTTSNQVDRTTADIFILFPGNEWISNMTVVSALSKTLKILLLGAQLSQLSKIEQIINELASVDEYMRKNFLSGDNQYNQMTRKEYNASLSAILTTVLALISTSFYMERNTTNVAHKVIICLNDWTSLIIFSVNLQLYTFCRMLTVRFEIINGKLKSVIEDPTATIDTFVIEQVTATDHQNDKALQLRKSFSSYWKLVDILDTIVLTYRMQILLGLCWSFLQILVDVYMIAYLVSKGVVTWLEALNVRPLTVIVQLVYLATVGTDVTEQARNTATILAYIERNSIGGALNEATQQEVTVFLERLKYMEICLPIYCILQLDLSLIISFMEGVSSYTIIMLQYNWLDK